jgi:hypothetical protein
MSIDRITALVVPFLAALVCGVAPAVATEAEPFGITGFSVQTTERTEELTVTSKTGPKVTGVEFVNKPYTFTQAGGHPWALTTTLDFATKVREFSALGRLVVPTQDVKDITVNLPPGLLGDPQALPRCPLALVSSGTGRCPADTQIGYWSIQKGADNRTLAPLINVTPEAGQSAEFAFENTEPLSTPLLTGHLIHTAQGYTLAVTSNSIPVLGIYSIETTFWGMPGDPSHDSMRGLFCESHYPNQPLHPCEYRGGQQFGSPSLAFLTMGTDCSAGPQLATVRGDSWQEPGSVGPNGQYSEQWKTATATMPGLTGCDLLAFNPSVEVQPDTLLADAPVGLGVNVQLPQSESAGSTGTPDLRDAVVTLPEGMSISPGVVDGIQACNATGPEGINIPPESGANPESEEAGLSGELQLAPGHCPDSSAVGTAEAITPLLPEPIHGHVFLARPGCGGAGQAPCTEQDALDGNLYQLYLELGGVGALGNTGINIKVAGKVEANPATGQLTTKFLGNPQTPFSELKIHLNGGPKASIDNPTVCGPATTTADFTPWSSPGITPEGLSMPGTPDATSSSFFGVEGCANPPGLNPGFSAGTVSPQGGAFSAFTMNLSRADREQFVKGIQVHTPPGLLGMLSSVPLCEEPWAENGHCPETSKIGTTRVASGAGSHPFEIGGNVYLTKGYGAAPFGLSIVTNAVAGPFNLGLVVVRARIAVDPADSSLTITTDETGPYAVPQILDGVPLRLKAISVNIDRPNFMFNPTSCAAQRITAKISGSQDATANVSSPFAAAGCKSLAFKPEIRVSTAGKTSRSNGASLDFKVIYPNTPQGTEANIAKAKVDLPKQLPSRLTTLQKACTAAQFDSNPAGCPAASLIGIVRVSTPLLPVSPPGGDANLIGPVYFVSHGGEAFPSLEIVLQGDGVRVDLVGSTFISKAGITSTTLKSTPDVPFSSFELYLPEGKFSALAANGNLCKSKLAMPMSFVAQNGAEINESAKVNVTGCPKTKTRKAKKAGKHRKSRHGHGRTGK